MAFETTVKRPQYFLLENKGLSDVLFYGYYLYLVIYLIGSDNLFIYVLQIKIWFFIIFISFVIININRSRGAKYGFFFIPLLRFDDVFFICAIVFFYLQLSNSLILVIILVMFGVLGLFLVIYINIIVLFKYY